MTQMHSNTPDRERERFELLNWLDDFVDAARRIDVRFPHPDEQVDRNHALFVTVQFLLGKIAAPEVAATLEEARRIQRDAFATAVQLAVLLVSAGWPKATAARACGIDRMSLYKALGER